MCDTARRIVSNHLTVERMALQSYIKAAETPGPKQAEYILLADRQKAVVLMLECVATQIKNI